MWRGRAAGAGQRRGRGGGGGVDLIEVDITLQSLLMQATSATGRPHTLLRVVRRTRHDYARLVAVHHLVESLVAHGGRRRGERQPVCARSSGIARNFPVWAVAVASALLASAVAVMIGASALAAVATVLVVLAVAGVNRLHDGSRCPSSTPTRSTRSSRPCSQAAVCGERRGRAGLRERDFAYIVAGGIVAMLPGRAMASAIEDVLFGFPLTGAGRLLAVFLALLGPRHRHRARA